MILTSPHQFCFLEQVFPNSLGSFSAQNLDSVISPRRLECFRCFPLFLNNSERKKEIRNKIYIYIYSIENYSAGYKRVAQVLVHLHRNDYVDPKSCDKEKSSTPGIQGSESSAALKQLLEGYDQQDQTAGSEVYTSLHFHIFHF